MVKKSIAKPSATNTAAQAEPDQLSKEQASHILAAYARMLTWSFGSTCALLAILTVLIGVPVWTADADSAPAGSSVFLAVFGSGALGAFFSSLIRLYSYDDLPKALLEENLRGLPKMQIAIYSLVPPVIGGISSGVLYLVFASGVSAISPLFPEFACPAHVLNECKDFTTFLDKFGPTGPVDYAKVLVWGFVAGFAERLVPDTLKGLASKVSVRDGDGS